MNLIAFLLPLGLVFVWGTIGYALVGELDRRGGALRTLLLAPIAGVSLLSLFAALINRLGVPVQRFAAPLTIALLLVAIVTAVRRRLPQRSRDWIPFAASLVMALGMAGLPLAMYGFNWVSFGNGDMTTYLLSAEHFYAHGYYEIPPLDQLMHERDPSWDYSFFYSYDEVRYAAQIMLAWLMSLTGLSAGFAYMPLMLGFHLLVVSTIGALMLDRPGRERPALIASLLLAVSPNFILGTLSQLLLQDVGMALVAAFAATFLRTPDVDVRADRGRLVLAGIFAGTLLITYPEMLPFAGLGSLVYIAADVVRSKNRGRGWLSAFVTATLATIVCTNTNLIGSLSFLLVQARASTPAFQASAVTFPEYLTPIGLGIFSGLLPYGESGGESLFAQILVQVAIIVGAILYVVAVVVSVRLALRASAVASISLIMLLFLLELFTVHSGFGLFKLVMYVQPFMIGSLVIGAALLVNRKAAVVQDPVLVT